MSELVRIVLLTAGAGACMPLGGAVASIERIQPAWLESELRHFVVALGGGTLLGAVTTVRVPEGLAGLAGSPWVIAIVVAGGIAFLLLERSLARRGRGSPQLLGMLLDYCPEALALGGLVASGSTAAPRLAMLIALQNLPEGYRTAGTTREALGTAARCRARILHRVGGPDLARPGLSMPARARCMIPTGLERFERARSPSSREHNVT